MSDPSAQSDPAPLRLGALLRLFGATLWRFGGQMTALIFLAITALVFVGITIFDTPPRPLVRKSSDGFDSLDALAEFVILSFIFPQFLCHCLLPTLQLFISRKLDAAPVSIARMFQAALRHIWPIFGWTFLCAAAIGIL